MSTLTLTVLGSGSGVPLPERASAGYWLQAPGLSSVSIGFNPLGWYLGAQENIVPGQHFDIVLPSAGGVNGATLADCTNGLCDFLWRDHASFGVTEGIWGILRVQQ